MINLETGAVVPETDPQGIDVADHEAPLRGKVVAVQWTVNGIISTSRTGNVKVEVTPSPTDWSGDWHMAGQWVWNNPSQYFVMDQWASTGNYPIYRGMIGFVSIAGDVRILVAHDGDWDGVRYGRTGTPNARTRRKAGHVDEQHERLRPVRRLRCPGPNAVTRSTRRRPELRRRCGCYGVVSRRL